ncbi:hypothetical protein K438DRAFT_1163694 [Mycena galopus ATCC 62051]|nr:hypothetical protein K438DRAFT_1163694 [Mycena galopus ATCC 62051]
MRGKMENVDVYQLPHSDKSPAQAFLCFKCACIRCISTSTSCAAHYRPRAQHSRCARAHSLYIRARAPFLSFPYPRASSSGSTLVPPHAVMHLTLWTGGGGATHFRRGVSRDEEDNCAQEKARGRGSHAWLTILTLAMPECVRRVAMRGARRGEVVMRRHWRSITERGDVPVWLAIHGIGLGRRMRARDIARGCGSWLKDGVAEMVLREERWRRAVCLT